MVARQRAIFTADLAAGEGSNHFTVNVPLHGRCQLCIYCQDGAKAPRGAYAKRGTGGGALQRLLESARAPPSG
jgi:hypothetical protein